MATLPRVFLPGPISPGPLTLPIDVTKRLAGVLRLSPGDGFMVFCGDGREYPAIVERASGRRLAARVEPVARQESPPALSVELYAGLVRANRMDLVVEKATEAGADVITPLLSKRTVRGEAPSANRYERWERIAIEAAEQSGRLFVPVLGQPMSFEYVLERPGTPLLVPHPNEMPWPEAARLLPERGPLAIVVGPEGGLGPEEVALARRKGAILASIGPHTLRSETAAVVATALVRAAKLH